MSSNEKIYDTTEEKLLAHQKQQEILITSNLMEQVLKALPEKCILSLSNNFPELELDMKIDLQTVQNHLIDALANWKIVEQEIKNLKEKIKYLSKSLNKLNDSSIDEVLMKINLSFDSIFAGVRKGIVAMESTKSMLTNGEYEDASADTLINDIKENGAYMFIPHHARGMFSMPTGLYAFLSMQDKNPLLEELHKANENSNYPKANIESVLQLFLGMLNLLEQFFK